MLKDSSEALSLLFAILLHKWAEILSIAVQLHKNSVKACHIMLLISIFVAVELLMLGVGWAILEFSATIVSVIASAFSAGVFMYMGATEVISEDFNGTRKYGKCFYYGLGVGVILVVTLITQYAFGHSHSH